MSDSTTYTHAEWHVKPGNEDDFIAAWRALGETFLGLEDPPLWGTLLRNDTDPSVFYSFGPWPSADAVAAMRADPKSQESLGRLIDLCESATPGPCSVVAHMTR